METDQRTSYQKYETPKAVLNTEHHKIYVELCYDEILKDNKPRTSFNKVDGIIWFHTLRKKKLGKSIYEAN